MLFWSFLFVLICKPCRKSRLRIMAVTRHWARDRTWIRRMPLIYITYNPGPKSRQAPKNEENHEPPWNLEAPFCTIPTLPASSCSKSPWYCGTILRTKSSQKHRKLDRDMPSAAFKYPKAQSLPVKVCRAKLSVSIGAKHHWGWEGDAQQLWRPTARNKSRRCLNRILCSAPW